jgi:hypothetical protein
MTQAFTICANNYLAHAKTLAASFKAHHKDVVFSIVVLDKPDATIDYNSFMADRIIWADDVVPALVNDLTTVYGIAELCTVIKPKLFEYFLNTGYDTVLYIDPDIKVYGAFNEVFSALKSHDMVLTPHICSPTGEKGHPLDKDLMRTGIYNLGFLALKKSRQTQDFIAWWHKRVVAFGFHDLKKGFFYDQIWLGFAPAFLDKVYVLRHLGYNMANWNLHERKLLQLDTNYYVNTRECPLKFFHFSHFKMENFPEIASYNTNYTLDNRPDIKLVYEAYKKDLLLNGYETIKHINYVYGKRPTGSNDASLTKQTSQNRINKALVLQKKVLKTLFKGKS